MMRVLIAGIDGYLGWSLAQYLASRGHEIGGIDAFLRRDWVQEANSESVIPVASMSARLRAFEQEFGQSLHFWQGDLRNYEVVEALFREFQPEAIVHFGEMPSAAYSMWDVEHCVYTQTNNLVGTLHILYAMKEVCPDAHLVKLGTMGEYGTPNVDIPEGFFEIEYRGRKDTLPFPRQAGSWYHQTKVHDSHNVHFACRNWGLRSTDLMQGVVFGTSFPTMGEDPAFRTRFDIDQCFGTVINRFCAQAVIEHPLTPYGKGRQTRGFLPLRDSMQCLALTIENPPAVGEYRVFNQLEDVYDVYGLAETVARVAGGLGLEAEVRPLENPRQEAEEHYYNPDRQKLLDLGYTPTHNVQEEIRLMIEDLTAFRDRIEAKRDILLPDIRWDGTRRRSEFLEQETKTAS